VETKKSVLIITDDTGTTENTANQIAAELVDYHVVIEPASKFAGNDILPAAAFFIGCESPNPPSFGYLTELLRHINLCGRPCGVFAPGSKPAVKYLKGLLHDCEAILAKEAYLGTGPADLRRWLKGIIK
jgi:hypothetical protein